VSVPCLLALCWLLFFHRLGDRGLYSSHEARAAQNARGVLDDGNWGLPRLFDQRVELQKPPLFYWLVAFISWLQGGEVDAWAVRLPAAVSALGCVLLVYLVGRQCGRPTAGFFAACILATCLHFTWLARVGRVDMPLTFLVSLTLAAFYLGHLRREQGRAGWLWFLLGYTSAGIGLLVKGPIAAVLPGLVIMAFLFIERIILPRADLATQATGDPKGNNRKARVLFRSSLWWGLPLVGFIAAPWFVWATIETNGRFLDTFFWHHNVERGLGGSDALAAQPWWFYASRLPVDLLPWSLLLPVALWFFLEGNAWRVDRDGRFGLVWFSTILLFLSLMRFKRADYLLPAYPGLALMLGCIFERWLTRSFSGEPKATAPRVVAFGVPLNGLFAAFLAVVLVGWIVYLEYVQPRQERHRSYQPFAQEIRRQTSGPVIFFRAEAHGLAFHVGRPLDTILEWENLDIWAGQPQPIYFVMPPDCAVQWPDHLKTGRLEEVLRSTELVPTSLDRPLVLLRSLPAQQAKSAGKN
jgi:4-amino-4-deoxy-L-arabinose transferase-like glycosyltransferase